MSHGTIEISAPRDHTRDVLHAAFHAALDLSTFADNNVKDAERGLALAKLAAESARVRAHAARAELDAYPPAPNNGQ